MDVIFAHTHTYTQDHSACAYTHTQDHSACAWRARAHARAYTRAQRIRVRVRVVWLRTYHMRMRTLAIISLEARNLNPKP
jgi:hypothetical protein